MERVLGRRRARMVRRRVGFVALGLGFTLLRPQPRVRSGRVVLVVGAVMVCVAVAGVGLPLR
jgi:hypothetical protein